MKPGRHGGRQLAEESAGGLPAAALALAAYAGVSDGPAGSAPAPRRWAPALPKSSGGVLAAAAARPRGGASHTPVKSGSLPIAAQSACEGAGRLNFCAMATTPIPREAITKAASIVREFVMC